MELKEEAKEGIKEDTKTDFPVPLTGNAYEHAQRLTIREITPKLEGFRADTEEKTPFYLMSLIVA